MLCVFLMLIRPRTKVSAFERLNSEHPVCSPHSKPMAAAWCRGLKPLCFSMQIAYLVKQLGFRGSEPFTLKSPIISLALPKGWPIYSQPRNNRMKLTVFLSFDFWPRSLFAKAPVPLDVSSWGSEVLDTAGMLPVDKGWPLSFVMGDFILRLSPSCEGWRPGASGVPEVLQAADGGTAYWAVALETWQVYLVHRGATFDSGLIKLAGLR